MSEKPGKDVVEGIGRFTELVDGPWAAQILSQLCDGAKRFNQIREALPGISPHTLTRRLRQFEQIGIVARTQYAEIPPRVEYAFTPLGRTMRPVLEGMGEWAMRMPHVVSKE